jgi:hypothetical protein
MAPVRHVRFTVNLKEAKKQWWRVWSKDNHAGAACTLCATPRAQTSRLIEGISGYVCDACVFVSVGVLSGDEASARHAACESLAAVLAALPEQAPRAVVEPLLEAMLRLAQDAAGAEKVFVQAATRGEQALAHRALTSIPEKERCTRVLMNLAATCIELERFDEAARAVEAGRAKADEDDLLFLDCHDAMLAAHTGRAVAAERLDELVARARRAANDELVSEALHASARHRAALGDTPAALAAVDLALALRRSSGLLLLRGDLLAERDAAGAREAWEACLAVAHPEGLDARRARERMQRGHPYRAR